MEQRGVAVVGHACRTPGARQVDQLWDIVATGRDVITRAATNIGATSGDRVHAYGVLDGADQFDEDFFGYSPREAAEIDPQQRLLLECAVEALESAGVRLDGLGAEVGVYASAGLSGYLLNTWSGQREGTQALPTLLGGDGHYAATRIAYKLGLTGPALSVGSACSSSLLAVHVAAQAILAGECDLALAGGMDVEFPQPMSYLYQDGGILSRDGVCRPFDRAANGTVFGSGGGVVLLADLTAAREHGWPVRAVLLGSAANNDGARKASFTAPRGSRQRDVIEQALALAGLTPDQVGYVECHGTATGLGDRTELQALREVFGPDTLPALGSVKANLGHLRVGAGVIGFIKGCEVAARGVVPPVANLRDPIDPAAGEDGGRSFDPSRHAVGVSSFGFGGTNVHALITGPRVGAASEPGADSYPTVLRLSSTGPESCLATARATGVHLSATEVPVRDVAYTLDRGRDDHGYRYAVVGSDRDAVAAGLADASDGVVAGWSAPTGDVLLVLPGQGSDVVPLVGALHGWETEFTRSFDELWSVVRDREPDVPEVDQSLSDPTLLSRPAAHALHVVTYLALTAQLARRGLTADLVAGYSLGEYAAAALAEAMRPADVIDLVLRRTRLLADAPAGDMIVVHADQARLAEVLPGRSPAITLSPERHVLAVLDADLVELAATLTAVGIGFRALGIGLPYHCAALADHAVELTRQAERYEVRPTDRLVTTSVSDLPIGAEYWGAHLARPVDFTRVGAMVAAMRQFRPCTVVDLSADGSLARAIGEAGAAPSDAVRLFCARQDLRESYLLGLAALWVRGLAVDTAAPGGPEGTLVRLPAREFVRHRYAKQTVDRSSVAQAATGRRTIRRERSLENWAYHPSWRLRRRPEPVAPAEGERWLVFAEPDGVSGDIAVHLAGLGVDCVRIAPETVDVAGWTAVRPGDERSVKDMVAALDVAAHPITRIIHLWCAGELADGETLAGRLSAMDDELARGFYTLLYAIQELSARQGARPIQLDLAARGIHPVGAAQDEVVPERSLLLGPALVVPQDLPFVSSRTVEITGLPDSHAAQEVFAELCCPQEDRAVAFAAGQRWVRGYERYTLPAVEATLPVRLREGGVYLITGGLGGIGMTLADYLVRACRARLVLTALEAVPDAAYWEGGRADLPEDPVLAERVTRVRKLVELGGEVLALRCDAASPQETGEMFQLIDERFGGLDGVVHAAGVFETQRAFRGLEETTAEDCVRRLLPKVNGTLVLAEHLRGRQLDFVLTQSSLSAQLGGLGFYAYTAGNAYMDAFAERHRSAEIPWMSVNWDGWIFRERTDDAGHQSVVSPPFASPDFGVVAEIAVRPSEGAEIYARMMDLRQPRQVLISTADFEARYDQWVRHPLPRTAAAAGPVAHDDATRHLDEVRARVAEVWREVLGVEEVAPESNFFVLGGDSLAGVTLAFRLGQVFGVVLSVITMFDNPTVAAMTVEIRRLAGALSVPAEPVTAGGRDE
jgi:acyl transferase domain-containing protein/acyl carrier protein